MSRRHQAGFQGRRPSSAQRRLAGRTSAPDLPEQLEVQALQLLQEGQLPEAEKLLRQCLEAGSCSASLYCNLAAICGMTDRNEQMIELLEQALRLRPEYPEALSNLGIAYQEQGHTDKAMWLYRQALKLRPDYPEALCNLGSALQERGQLAEAISAYQQAIASRHHYPEAHANLALAHRAQGEHEQAIAASQHALALCPNHREALLCQAQSLQEAGETEGAIQACQQAATLLSDHPESLCTLAHLLRQLGQHDAAIAAYRRALALQPADPVALVHLGDALKETRQYSEAIACFKQALSLKPEFPQALSNLGIVHQILGDSSAAIAAYRRAIAQEPGFAAAHSNLGISLSKQGDDPAAIDAFREAIRLEPDFAEAHSNLGIALEESGQLEAAIASYRRALELQPEYPEAFCNLGNALQEIGDITACLAAYQKAVELRSDYADARKNLSMALLLIGQYQEGWEAYEWRLHAEEEFTILNALPWGEPCQQLPPPGSSLLLVSEQGFGDTLQFMRYVHPLRQRGLQVRLCAPPKLHGLIQSSGIDAAPLAPEQVHGRELGPWLPLLSLPRHLGVTADQPLIHQPYLQADDSQRRRWQAILAAEDSPIIALNWQGNPDHEKSTSKGRSLPLEALAPLARIDGVRFLSLQKGYGSEQLERCSFRDRFVRCQDLVSDTWDFLETAAIIANCDLVISSDTSAAHLAAGLGHPTWLLLKHIAEWRWGLEGDRSGWYPSMRLFRQRHRGDWNELMERVGEALQRHLRHLRRPAAASRRSPPKLAADPDAARDPAGDTDDAVGRGAPSRPGQPAAGLPAAISHYNHAVAMQQCGDLNAAIEAYRQALALQPEFPEALGNLGVALQALGQLQEAIETLSRAVELRPDYVEALSNLGNAWQAQGEHAQAIAAYTRALELRPTFAEAFSNLGTAYKDCKDYAAAEQACRRALSLKPDYPEALSNLGNVLQAQGDIEAAIDCYRQALVLRPDYANAHYNLGIALKEQDRLHGAIAAYDRAIALQPDSPNAHSNKGNAWQELGEIDKAIAAYQAAIHYREDHPAANKNLSMALLLKGDYQNGWPRYEWRFRDEPGLDLLFARPDLPRWDGSALPAGQRLTLVGEQGLGDVLQFMRYVLPLRERGIVVSLCAVRKLHGLIQASGLDDAPLTPSEAQCLQEGCWLPLLSLPQYLNVTAEDPVVNAPYLHTTQSHLDTWAEILGREPGLLIGLNWQGNPEHEKTNSKGRSLPLEAFARLATLDGVRFVSLQKGHGSEQLDSCSFRERFVGCQPQVSEAWDFLDTAAIVAQCDLVISSDTALAHLAGGMGKTTWLLLKDVPEWRWGLHGDASGWYPSMRLFRQRQRGNWDEVMQRVLLALQLHLGCALQPRLFGDASLLNSAAMVASRTPATTLQRAEACFASGQWRQAETLYRDLIETGQQQPQLFHRLGQICGLSGRYQEMSAWIEQGLALAPEDPGALCNLGLAYQELGDLQKAGDCYSAALEQNDEHVEAHCNLGTLRQAQGDVEEALRCYRRALDLRSGHPEALCNLGLCLQEQGDLAGAEQSYRQAMASNPDCAIAHYNLGCLQYRNKNWEAAVQSYLETLRLQPDHPEVYTSLGNAYKRLGQRERAIEAYEKALHHPGDIADPLCNLGTLYLSAAEHDLAIAYFQRALAADNRHAEAAYNLGIALQSKGDLPGAIEAYQRSVRNAPDFAEAHGALAMALLLTGHYRQGWVEYEWRFQTEHGPQLLTSTPDLPRWDGTPLAAGRQLLLVAEQGLGDTFQFLRYALILQQQGLEVSLCAAAKLHGVIRTSIPQLALVLPEQVAEIREGVWIPLLSLPGLLGVSPEQPLINRPYLQTPEQLIGQWRNRLAGERWPVVAIHWQGNPDHEQTTSRGRSLPLEAFAPLAHQGRLRLLSLQKGYGSEQLDDCSFRDQFVACQDQIDATWDFLETAAIIANCDLVISSDTAIAHLAAGMGKPTWLLLQHIPEWRWGLEGDRTFWYPTMRLFRQQQPGDWDELMRRVAGALQGSHQPHTADND